MDIVRKDRPLRRWIWRGLIAAVGVALLAGATVAISSLKRAAPVIDADTLWTGTVERGELLREVLGNGTLVPKEVRWIPAPNEGRVERILARPGEKVEAATVIIELSNPVLERDALDAQWQLAAVEAELRNLRAQLDSERLAGEEAVVTADGAHEVAKLAVERDQKLFDSGLLAQQNLSVSLALARELKTRHEFAERRLVTGKSAAEAQLASQEARVEQFQALIRLRQKQVDDLEVKAGAVGVVQQVLVEEGQQVTRATSLAKVVRPEELKAELKVSETQTRDIAVGQLVNVDTRNGVTPGHVVRIDPAVQNGTVLVEVALDGPLPKGARPDLSVQGTIEIERLANVLHTGRPVSARADTRIGLFKLEPGGRGAVRKPVLLGKMSVHAVQIIEGLEEGDRIILSDMSKWEHVDRIRLR